MRRVAQTWLLAAALLAPGAVVSADAPEEQPVRAPLEDAPEDLGERLYLRERPESLGEVTRDAQEERLHDAITEREARVLTERDRAIVLLEVFVRGEPESAAEMPDALLRLAELRWEQARADYLVAFAAWQQVPEATRGPEPHPDYRAAMTHYDRILERHRGFDRYDFVLYMKAYALVEANDTDGALALYRRILQEFPQSRFAADAHFALAESAFNAGRIEESLAEYDLVMSHRESELYDLALFKGAFCLWRLNRNQDAALRFRQVLDLGGQRAQLTATQRRRLRDLQDEALDYLIQVFIEDESNTANDLFEFLREIGGEQYANRVLRRLSDTYMGQARYERAVEAYALLLRLTPNAREAPDWQMRVAEAWAAAGDTTKTMEALGVLASTYGPNGEWAAQQGDPELVARANRRAERAVRKRALKYHEIGQRESQRRMLENAVALYTIYLEHYGSSPKAYEVQFFQAEILFHRLERYSEAGDAYLGAAHKNPQGRFTRDALYNAIGSFERVRESQPRCTPAAPAPTPAPAPQTPPAAQPQAGQPATPPATAAAAGPERCGETENDRKLGEAIELYVQLFPNDPDLPEILFRQGKLYYDRGIYDPAVRLFGQLLDRFPESPYSADAGELILDSFNRAQDFANIEQWARRLKTAPAFRDDAAQRRLDGLILQSMFKIGEQLDERGEHAEAANAYLRAAEEFPRDERAAKAVYNAGVARQRGGDMAGAAAAYDILIERYPGSEEGALGTWAAAQMYESIAQFSDAARYYEAYGEHFPRGPKASDSMYNAVLLRLTAGDYDEAVRAGNAFLRKFPRHESADDVSFFVGRAHEGAEDWSDAATTYRQFIRRARNADRKVEAQTRLAQVLLRAGDARAAERALEEAVQYARRSRGSLHDGLYYAAQARYLQGERVLAEYEAIRIAGDIGGLRQRLERKSSLLQRAALVYADVVEYGVPEWVTAALYQIGRSFELFAEAMREFEVPEGLSEEEQQAYLDQLAMFIVPMEERALEAYEGGYQKALELRIFNEWTARLREALTRLNDVQYPPLRETGGALPERASLPLPQPVRNIQRGEVGTDDEAAQEEGED